MNWERILLKVSASKLYVGSGFNRRLLKYLLLESEFHCKLLFDHGPWTAFAQFQTLY